MNVVRNNEILKTAIDQDGIFRLTLNNQNNHNALSEEMMSNIQAALDESISNKKIRVVIISAEGPTFSSGHDLKELTQGRQNPDKGKNYFTTVMNKCSNLMQTIVNNPNFIQRFMVKEPYRQAQGLDFLAQNQAIANMINNLYT